MIPMKRRFDYKEETLRHNISSLSLNTIEDMEVPLIFVQSMSSEGGGGRFFYIEIYQSPLLTMNLQEIH